MTDRIKALTVLLEQDTREDDIKNLVQAIGMMRGVLSIEMEVADIDLALAERRAKAEIRQKLWELLK